MLSLLLYASRVYMLSGRLCILIRLFIGPLLIYVYIHTYLTLHTHLVPVFRVPSVAIAELEGHQAALNGIVWAPHSASHVCTCGDDKQILIWDLAGRPKTVTDPILAFSADGEINGVQVSIICVAHMYYICTYAAMFIEII